MAKQTTQVAETRERVLEERARLDGLTGDQDEARVELAGLEETGGSEVLDDPTAAGRIGRRMAELREQDRILSMAITTQAERVAAAERAYLLAEADVLRGPVREAERALAAHEKRTQQLLDQLEQHEGRFVSEYEHSTEVHDLERAGNIATTQPRVFTVPKSLPLAESVTRAQRPVAVLESLAHGQDPAQDVARWEANPEEVYPACVWGHDALVPAPGWRRRVEVAARKAQDLRAMKTRLEGTVAYAERRDSEVARDTLTGERVVRVAGEQNARNRLATIDEEIAAAEAEAGVTPNEASADDPTDDDEEPAQAATA